jgi:hypothetical protein
VTSENDGLRLWYSYRGADFRRGGDAAYRISSVTLDTNGVAFGDAEPVVFENPPLPGDFDDWMQAFACVACYEGMEIMLYNGNDFGRSGFGWATRRRTGA